MAPEFIVCGNNRIVLNRDKPTPDYDPQALLNTAQELIFLELGTIEVDKNSWAAFILLHSYLHWKELLGGNHELDLQQRTRLSERCLDFERTYPECLESIIPLCKKPVGTRLAVGTIA